MARGAIYCKHCGKVTDAHVINWDDWAWDRDQMGNYSKHDTDPPIRYFRRIRRCSNCDMLLYTAEVDSSLVHELAELRNTLGELRADIDRASAVTRAMRKKLPKAAPDVPPPTSTARAVAASKALNGVGIRVRPAGMVPETARACPSGAVARRVGNKDNNPPEIGLEKAQERFQEERRRVSGADLSIRPVSSARWRSLATRGRSTHGVNRHLEELDRYPALGGSRVHRV